MTKVTQLRIYTINKGMMNEYVQAWRTGVVPLRQYFGFTIEGGWVIEGENRFVWIVSAQGTQDIWLAKEQAYYTSPERKALNPDPAFFVAHVETRFITSVLE